MKYIIYTPALIVMTLIYSKAYPQDILKERAEAALISDFQSVVNNNVVNLTWVVKKEINPSVFQIDRSLDGVNYIPIAEKKGFPSALDAHYYWNDYSPPAGKVIYRIVKTSNGVEVLSEKKEVQVPGKDHNYLLMDIYAILQK